MVNIIPDMAALQLAEQVTNPSPQPTDWEMVIYGPAVDPHVSIGGNMVEVKGSVPAGGRVTINSLDRTIRLTTGTGLTTSIFDRGVRGAGRGSGRYCFEQISPGTHPVLWPNGFGVDIRLIEQRSEPQW